VGTPAHQLAAWARETLTAGMGRGFGEADFAALIEEQVVAAGTGLS
jgi:hypothetical protein